MASTSAFHPLQTSANVMDSWDLSLHLGSVRWRQSLLLLPLLASCGSCDRQATDNRVIFPAGAAREMLGQCSRGAPEMGEKAWQPTDDDVDALEAILPGALAKLPQARVIDFSNLLVRWRRQYVGIVRGGRRFIYGNFFPAEDGDEFERGGWRKEKFLMCDGGANYFGVEFDTSTRRLTRLDFNRTQSGSI